MKLKIPQATKAGYVEVDVGQCFDMTYPSSLTRRGRVQGGGDISPAITASGEVCVYEGLDNEESAEEFRGDGLEGGCPNTGSD